jgi:hypothetical protein
VIEDYLSIFDTVKKSQSNRAMERLFNIKVEELPEYQLLYWNSASELITLGGHLNIITSTKYSNTIFSGYNLDRYLEADVQFLMGKETYNTRVNVERYNYGRFAVRRKLKEQMSEKVESIYERKANSLFSACYTQGCVYYLSEDISMWLKMTQVNLSSMNIPVNGLDSFKGPKFSVKRESMQKALDRLADSYADGKETSY